MSFIGPILAAAGGLDPITEANLMLGIERERARAVMNQPEMQALIMMAQDKGLEVWTQGVGRHSHVGCKLVVEAGEAYRTLFVMGYGDGLDYSIAGHDIEETFVPDLSAALIEMRTWCALAELPAPPPQPPVWKRVLGLS